MPYKCNKFLRLDRGNFQLSSCDLLLAKKFGIKLSPWITIAKI